MIWLWFLLAGAAACIVAVYGLAWLLGVKPAKDEQSSRGRPFRLLL